MNFQSALRYLNSLQLFGVKFGLENTQTILAALNNPQKKFPSILVGGTNGKGSVCAFTEKIFSLHGYRVGLYTSPHLVSVRERIKIGEKLISEEEFAEGTRYLKSKIDDLLSSGQLLAPLTYFEFLTALAFLYFAQQGVDLAVVEVGMGGRFDATNVLDPICSVVTSISIDHEKFLGSTLGQIAREKGGIIKKKKPIITSETEEEALRPLQEKAAIMKAPLIKVFTKEDDLKIIGQEGLKTSFCFSWQGQSYTFTPSLLGFHQGRNAACALVVAKVLSPRWFPLEEEKIIEGLQQARWEGRLEIISSQPLFLVDGAHNPSGARALQDFLGEVCPHPDLLIFACMRDKKIAEMANILFPAPKRIILTQFPYHRSAFPQEILRQASSYRDKITIIPEVKLVLEEVKNSVLPQGVVVAAGSLYLIGEIKKYWSF